MRAYVRIVLQEVKTCSKKEDLGLIVAPRRMGVDYLASIRLLKWIPTEGDLKTEDRDLSGEQDG
jgi:hypothetical protein